MGASHFEFVDVVAAGRDLVVTGADDHVCRLEPRASELGWHCALDDGTPTGESDPASFVRWVCPDLRLGRTTADGPARVLDAALRSRIESWPPARHGDGVVRPAELSSIRLTGEGLVVESVSWWDSALALDHQIGLALDIADRLAARR